MRERCATYIWRNRSLFAGRVSVHDTEMRHLVLILALLLGTVPALSGYCPPDRVYWPAELRQAPEPSSDAQSLRYVALGLLVAFLAFLIGRASVAGPTQAAIIAAVGRGITGRIGEAGVHSRRKIPPALRAAQTAVEAEIGKLYQG